MIFLILGTQKFQLNRLLREMDELYKQGKIKERTFAQIGCSDYLPHNYDYIDFLDRENFEDKIKESDLIITHSGVGSILTSLKYEKPVIVYPRLCKYKEHVDDHQLEIAKAFAKRKYVLYCGEDDDLYEVIKQAKYTKFEKYTSSTHNIVRIITDFLKE